MDQFPVFGNIPPPVPAPRGRQDVVWTIHCHRPPQGPRGRRAAGRGPAHRQYRTLFFQPASGMAGRRRTDLDEWSAAPVSTWALFPDGRTFSRRPPSPRIRGSLYAGWPEAICLEALLMSARAFEDEGCSSSSTRIGRMPLRPCELNRRKDPRGRGAGAPWSIALETPG